MLYFIAFANRIITSFLIEFIVGGFVFAGCFLILKKGNLIRSKKFLYYILLAAFGAALVAGIYSLNPFLSLLGFYGFLSSPLLLGLYNYWLSRRFFNLERKKAIFIGLMMGIFTSPLFFILLLLLFLFLSCTFGNPAAGECTL